MLRPPQTPWTKRIAGFPTPNYGSRQAARLFAWWPCTEPGGLIVREATGRGPHGTIGSASVFSRIGTAEHGPALSANASTSGVALASSALPLGGNFTLSFWVKPVSGFDSSAQPMFGLAGFNRFELGWGNTAGGVYSFFIWLSGIDYMFVSGSNCYSHGNWFHIVYTRDGTGQANNRVFVNGVEIANIYAASQSLSTVTESYYLHSANAASSPIADSLDWRFYDRAMSAAEVWQLYAPATRWDLYAPLTRPRLWFDVGGAAAGTPRSYSFIY